MKLSALILGLSLNLAFASVSNAENTCSDVLIRTPASFSYLENLTMVAVTNHYRNVLGLNTSVELRGFGLWEVSVENGIKTIVITARTNFYRAPMDPGDAPVPDDCFVTLININVYDWSVTNVDCFPIN